MIIDYASNEWLTTDDLIYTPDGQVVKAVYAGNKKVYPIDIPASDMPAIFATATGLSGTTPSGMYMVPWKLYFPWTTLGDDGYYHETIDPSTGTLIKGVKYENTKISSYKVYRGVYEYALNITPNYETIEVPSSYQYSMTIPYKYQTSPDGKDTTYRLTVDTTKKFVVDGILLPIINRYLIAYAIVKEGYETYIPSWMAGYKETDFLDYNAAASTTTGTYTLDGIATAARMTPLLWEGDQSMVPYNPMIFTGYLTSSSRVKTGFGFGCIPSDDDVNNLDTAIDSISGGVFANFDLRLEPPCIQNPSNYTKGAIGSLIQNGGKTCANTLNPCGPYKIIKDSSGNVVAAIYYIINNVVTGIKAVEGSFTICKPQGEE